MYSCSKLSWCWPWCWSDLFTYDVCARGSYSPAERNTTKDTKITNFIFPVVSVVRKGLCLVCSRDSLRPACCSSERAMRLWCAINGTRRITAREFVGCLRHAPCESSMRPCFKWAVCNQIVSDFPLNLQIIWFSSRLRKFNAFSEILHAWHKCRLQTFDVI